MNLVTILVLFLQLASGQSAVSPLSRLQAKIAVVPVASLSSLQIAGQYSNPSKELIKQIGGVLSGDDLYIFPDKTYVYCEWADVMLNTVIDKGAWSFAAGVLELKSDPEITWDPKLERRFLVVRRRSHAKEILLVGIEKDLPYFEKEAGDNPELMLLIVARQRGTTVGQRGAARLKAKLMREGWRPDSFREQP